MWGPWGSRSRAARAAVAAFLLVALVAGPRIAAAEPQSSSPDADAGSGPVRVMVEVAAPDLSLLGPVGEAVERLTVATTVDRLSEEAVGSVDVVREYTSIPHFAAEVDSEGLAALEADPDVVSVVPDTPRYASLAESIPIVEADAAWADGYEGSGQTVAIIDSGVDGAHPMLSGKVTQEACFSVGSDCPNGFSTQTGAGSGVPCVGCPDNEHGTHVAGIAAGDGPTLDGVARSASVFSIMAGSVETAPAICGILPSCLVFWDSDLVAGLDHVYSRLGTVDVAAVNMSIGGGLYTANCDLLVPALTSAVDRLKNAGVAVVVSAGNDGSVTSLSFPACVSSTVSVGSSTDADTRSSFSNAGPELDVFAPGSLIRSSVPGGGYQTWNGTSMAAPHVTGAFALFKDADPAATPNGILSALKSTGVPIAVVAGRTAPRIRIGTALDAYLSGNTPRDHAKVIISGGISYANDGDLVSGDFKIRRGTFTAVDSVTGGGEIPSASGSGQATVSISLRSFLGLPLYFGNLVVVDPGAGRSVNAVLLFPSVGLAGSTASGSSSWFSTSSFPWSSYNIAWQITDAA